MKTILSALLWFFKTMKDGKSGPGKYYYFLLPNNRSIRVGAQYSTTLVKKIKNITVRLGSNHGIQIEKWSSQRKTFDILTLKEKNKFLGYLAILKLSRKKYITQKWERRGLLWREVAAELISTTTYYRNGYIWKKVAWQCSLYYQLSRNFFNTWFRGPLIR